MPDSSRRTLLQRTLGRLPNWALVLVISVAVAAVPTVLRLLTGERTSWGHVAAAAVWVPVIALAMLWGQKRERRIDRSLPAGSPEKGRAEQAVTAGSLPRDARADEWVPELEKIIRTDWKAFPFLVLLILGFVGLSIALNVVGDAEGRSGVVYLVLSLAALVATPIWMFRRRRTVERLIAQVKGRTMNGEKQD